MNHLIHSIINEDGSLNKLAIKTLIAASYLKKNAGSIKQAIENKSDIIATLLQKIHNEQFSLDDEIDLITTIGIFARDPGHRRTMIQQSAFITLLLTRLASKSLSDTQLIRCLCCTQFISSPDEAEITITVQEAAASAWRYLLDTPCVGIFSLDTVRVVNEICNQGGINALIDLCRAGSIKAKNMALKGLINAASRHLRIASAIRAEGGIEVFIALCMDDSFKNKWLAVKALGAMSRADEKKHHRIYNDIKKDIILKGGIDAILSLCTGDECALSLTVED